MSDLVGNPEDRFSHDEAHIYSVSLAYDDSNFKRFLFCFIFQKATGNDESDNASGFINLLLIALAIFSTAYNVILYVVFNPSFKEAIIGCFRCTSASAVNSVVSGAETGKSPESPQETPLSDVHEVNVLPGSSTNVSVITTIT